MTPSAIDTSAVLEIAASPRKLILMALGDAVFAYVGWSLAQPNPASIPFVAVIVNIVGWAMLLFFGLCAVVYLWRLFTQRGAVVTLSPEGLRDVRCSPDVIAWPIIVGLSTWRRSFQKIMIVALKPGEEEKLKLTAIARWTRGANAKLGADGLAIAAQGIKIRHRDLLEAATAYAQRYGG